jgi:cytochrome c biogenesis protein CcdA/thiol-disulfide isomerase/thioredoxin
MWLLLGVGFLGGVITGVSPCILPVLPVVLAGGATARDRRRPYLIIAGLVASFSTFTLVGGSLLSALHLPQDSLRTVGIAALLLLALGLLVPQVGEWLERPFARLTTRPRRGAGSGFLLGASLGVVFVPCAGPVLAAISIVAATHRVGAGSVLLTLAYAIGAALPLLIVALVSEHASTHWRAVRDRAPIVRKVAGGLVALTAIAIAFNLTQPLQTNIPGYTSALEAHIEGTPAASTQLQKLTGEHANKFASASKVSSVALPDLGQAPPFTDVTKWLNTPAGKPLELSSLHGKVVLVDFWTYSCINCIRTLPHVEAWYRAYKNDGFVVVGVQTPEFAFEHVVSNVVGAAARLGVHYPIAVDNNYGTWDAYGNQYWPAEYLIDQNGDVREASFGEGDYATTETNIRSLLASGGHRSLPARTDVPNLTPTGDITPETYVGYSRLSNYVGSPLRRDVAATYTTPARIPENAIGFRGTWTVRTQSATAGADASIVIEVHARDVYLVAGGTGTIGVYLNGVRRQIVTVSGIPRLYPMLTSKSTVLGNLELKVSPGVSAYDFTFG